MKTVLHVGLIFLLLFTFFNSNIFAGNRKGRSKNVRKNLIEYKFSQIFSQEDINQIANLSETIVNNCKPLECINIGVGRSPSVITAFIKAINSTYASNLPLSHFKYSTENPLLPSEEKVLFDHFDRFLGKYLGTQELKRINIIDFSLTGKSIISVENYLKKYLESKKSKIDVQKTILTTSEFSRNVNQILLKKESLESTKLVFEMPKDSSMAQGFLSHKGRNYSEFGEFDIKNPNRVLELNPDYSSLVRFFEKQMNNIPTTKKRRSLGIAGCLIKQILSKN